MKISCELVKDLLPLYNDDVCSKESRTIVEKHLKECDNCKKYLESMDTDFFQKHIEKTEEQVKVNVLKGLKKKLFLKNVVISIISVICAIGVCFGGYFLIFIYEMPIPYEDGLLSFDISSDGEVTVILNEDAYFGSKEFTRIIEKDGKEQNIAYIYYTDSIWTKYFSKTRNHNEYRLPINNDVIIGSDNHGRSITADKDITAVYYETGDFRDIILLSDEKFAEATKDAVLVWEK